MVCLTESVVCPEYLVELDQTHMHSLTSILEMHSRYFNSSRCNKLVSCLSRSRKASRVPCLEFHVHSTHAVLTTASEVHQSVESRVVETVDCNTFV